MTTLLYAAGANLIVAALLAVLAFLVGRYSRRPALAHSLWLLVLLKLVTPPLVPVPILRPAEPPAAAATAPTKPAPAPARPANGWITTRVEANFAVASATESWRGMEFPPVQFQTEDAFIIVQPAPLEATATLVPVIPPELLLAPPPDAKLTPGQCGTAKREASGPLFLLSPRHFITVLGWVWLAGSAAWFAWAACCLLRFRCLLRCARPAPPEVQRQARELAERIGLRTCPTVYLLPGPLPPMVWAGVGPARLYFPADLLDRLDDSARAALLTHELAHIRRRDHWVRWLELVVAGLYWWCPLVWWARRQLHLREEECCDAWVVGELPPRAYASAILETVDFLADNARPLPVVASGLRRLDALKHRLISIMEGRTPKRLSVAGRLIVLVLATCLPVLPTRAQPEEEKPAAKQEPNQPAADPPTSGIGRPGSPAARQEPKQAAAEPTLETADEAPKPSVFNRTSVELQIASLDITRMLYSPGGTSLFVAGSVPSPVLAMAHAPRGTVLALALEDGTVQLRDSTSGTLLRVLRGHTDAATCLAFSPDGATLATGSPDTTVRLWDVATGKEKAKLTDHTSWVYALAFSPDGKTLVSAGYDRVVRLWDVTTGKPRGTLTGHEASVRGVAFAPDGEILATGGGDQTIKLWDLETRKEQATLRGHDGTVRAIAFAPDGKSLASAGSDGTVRLWNVEKARERLVLRGHANEVWAVAFAPKGLSLATAGLDRTVLLWDPKTGARRGTFRGHSSGVSALAFRPDGRHLLSAGHDRMVKSWGVIGAGSTYGVWVVPAYVPPGE